MKKEKNYNIGLDIGVASVGWCVTDDENNIIKNKSRNMWGSRLFDEAETAAKRRGFRSARRRLDRRKERIKILQSLLLDDMEEEHPNFFPLLKETSFIREDKNISTEILGRKYNLFYEKDYNDMKYYDQFPTIYHLRDYLINTTEKVDLRLVYLAIHHIIKYRGNFLYETSFSENSSEINEKIDNIIFFLSDRNIYLKESKGKILEILKSKNVTRATKRDLLLQCFEYDKTEKQLLKEVLGSILGYAFDISKIFDIDMEKSKITFSKEIENEEEIKEKLNDYDIVYEDLKTIYSWFVLQDLLKGKTFISEAFKDKYEEYKTDLTNLKTIYKKYLKDKYNKMFKKEGENNYVAYTGKSARKKYKKCNYDNFIKEIQKDLKTISENDPLLNEILVRISNKEFLRKLNVTDNAAIPRQLHEIELKRILDNQSKYYKTIKENKDNILKLFNFRIQYFVGPLAKTEESSPWSWVIRNSDENIYPWNFEKVVNIEETAEKFIRRMTNKCTYLINEDVIPKQSLLYSKFCVLNELNNIRINERVLKKDTKQFIIDNLFKKRKKVTKKMVVDLLKTDGIKVESLSGLSDGENFTSNMSSYVDLSEILGKIDEANYDMCENLIYWCTIFEEKKILKEKIKKEYGNVLTDDQIKKIVRKRFTGWSRLSKRLLIGIKSYDGESIMEKLEKTKYNFMQLINNKDFGFAEEIEKLLPKVESNLTYKNVDNIPTSPANKRAIWQSICVVKEITKVMKKEPKNIYIEFARKEDSNKSIRDTRSKKLLKIYDDIEKQLIELKNYDHNVYMELKKHQSDKVLTDKLFLYFIQNGKSLYSGKPLNIDELDSYEIDHIIPRSYKLIDGIDNKALVLKTENQDKKNMLVKEVFNISQNHIEWWKSLLEAGLISQTKFGRLIKKKMFETDNDREKFIERQLVETRQITKYVTNILTNTYKDTFVFAIRAELTSLFRKRNEIYKNRNVNNYHHAQDAYILNVIGNVLSEKWNGVEEFKYSEYVKKYLKNKDNEKEKCGMIIGFVNKNIDLEKIRKVLDYKDCYISRMTEEETGEFYNQTLIKAQKSPVIPLKNGKAPEKYGGYTNEYKAYFSIIEYENQKNNKEYLLVGIPVVVAYMIKQGKTTLEEYLNESFIKKNNYKNLKILRNKILKEQEYIDETGMKYRFCSDSEIRVSKELILNKKMQKLIYFMNVDENKLEDKEKEELENNYEYMFEYLKNKLINEYPVFESIYNKIKEKIFSDLSASSKKLVINGLIDLMETGQGNLKEVGLSDREGRMSKKTFNTKKLINMTIIDKSVTGMYERRFRVNGMENCSSK